MVKKRRTPHKSRNADMSPARRGDELVSARDRFKGVLQDLIPPSEEESVSASDDEGPKSKRHYKKKNQSDRSSDSKSNQQHPFVMKLFDRSVDLAQFSENTPLYVVCRAWMANQPHQSYKISMPPPKRPRSPEIKEEPMSPERQEEDVVKDTYSLPPPFYTYDNEDGSNVRIPKTMKRVSEFNKMFEEGVEPPSKDQLLKDNQKHWQKVKKSWHEASSRNEERYSKSLKTLVTIFNRAQRQQT